MAIKHFPVFPIVLLLALYLPVAATQAGPRIESWQTENGVKVLYVVAPDLPMVDVRIVFDAGSARDGDAPGISSLTNTLLTEGAGDWNANQIAERLENVGAELGTGSLRDMGWVNLRSLTEENALQEAISTLSAVLSRPHFAVEDLERERESMLVSLRQAEQDPGTVGKKALYRRLYGEHPYAIDPEGTSESVTALTPAKVKAFYQRYYVARNATLAIVGAVDRAAAERLVTQVVGALPAGEPAAKIPAVADVRKDLQEPIVFPSTQAHVYVAQPGLSRDDPDYFALYVGNHVLGGSGLVSLLSGEVREKRGLSYSVYSYFLPMRQRGPFMLGLQTKQSQAAEAQKVMLDELRRFVQQGPTDEQLTAAKQNITGGFPLRIASNKKIIEYLTMIGFYGLPLDYLDTFVQQIEAVTADQIRDAFQRRIHPDRLIRVVVGPGKETIAKP